MEAKNRPDFDLDSVIENGFTEETAAALYEKGREAVIYVLLRVNPASKPENITDASTPSGMVAPYLKPSKSRHRKPGQKQGHVGTHRQAPEKIDKTVELRAECCPYCGGTLKRRKVFRKRYVTDIPEVEPETTEYIVSRDWCPHCRKVVEPKVTEALPNCSVGLCTQVMSAWWHYELALPISKIMNLLTVQYNFEISQGGLFHQWCRIAEILSPWHTQIKAESQNAAFLHCDETGWRVNGKTWWLWSFTNPNSTYYTISKSRGQKVVRKFFNKGFSGVLVSDFWSAYNAVKGTQKQRCLVHLLRDIEKITEKEGKDTGWQLFAKPLKRLLRDGFRLKVQIDKLSPADYEHRRDLILDRFAKFIQQDWAHHDAKRLLKRLRRYKNEIFTFLNYKDVSADNNQAERSIRSAVIMRKNSFCNRSRKGARAQAVLMSIFKTLQQRNLSPTETIVNALKEYVRTGVLPPLPKK